MFLSPNMLNSSILGVEECDAHHGSERRAGDGTMHLNAPDPVSFASMRLG